MFNDKRYLEVNREERFFCSLFAHSLLMSQQVRDKFAARLSEKLSISLDPYTLEVYVEAAALRDYWSDLGNPRVYTEETHTKRRNVLKLILELELFKLPVCTLDKYDLFWTSDNGKRGRKLWNPNRWSDKELEQIGLEDTKLKDLKSVKWAFNAKPDILLISRSTVLLIEAKLESGEGKKKGTGYEQYETLKLIAVLWKLLIPKFSGKNFHITTLELKPTEKNITWQDILNLVKDTDVDSFSRDSLRQLQRYYT